MRPIIDHHSRRVLMATIAAFTIVATSCTGGSDDPTPSPGDPDPVVGSGLTEPQTFTSQDGQLQVTLTAEEREVEIDGETVRARVYNGGFAAPTIVVRPGDTLEVSLENRLAVPTNLHFHGFHVSPKGKSDNIFRDTDTGQTERYVLDIPADHEPGLYWYHSHLHGISEGQVFGGLSGMLIVEGLTELLPPGLQDAEQHYMALRDFQVIDGEIPAENIDSGADTVRVVNGQVNPSLTIAPGESQVWHLANIGADIWYDVELEGHELYVLAEDASPVWEVWRADHLVMPPGKRYEVLIVGSDPGTYELKTRAFDQGSAGDQYPEATLATLTSEGDEVATVEQPDGLVPQNDLRERPIAETRRFVFTEKDTANKFFINGKLFDPARVDADPIVGTVEQWTLVNATEEQHPFHIHVNDFQVLSIDGEPYRARGLQDTVPLPVGAKVVILNPFDDFTGKYVFHCHILAHEDLGMMAVVDVLNERGESEAQGTHEGHGG
jgi:FtsP/CotA-like multicopper oxidase with cupredoxin domain